AFPSNEGTVDLVFSPDGKTLMLSGFQTVITLLETEPGPTPPASVPVDVQAIPSRAESIALAEKGNWSDAKSAYQKLLAIGHNNDHIRFEFGCLQLLAGDDAGYQQSMRSIIDDAETMTFRAFL